MATSTSTPTSTSPDAAVWLSPELLLLARRPDVASTRRDAVLDAAAVPGARRPSAPASRLVMASPPERLELVVVGTRHDRAGEGVVYEVDGDTFVIDGGELAAAGTDVTDLARRLLARRDATDRASILEFLLEGTLVGSEASAMGEPVQHLVRLRELLRERLPLAVVERHTPAGVHVEAVVAADHHTFYLRGWVGHPSDQLDRVTAVSPEGERIEVLPDACRYRRDDVSSLYELPRTAGELGFATHLTTVAPSRADHGWLLEVVTASGAAAETRLGPVVRGLDDARDLLLGDLDIDPDATGHLCERHLHPALERLEQRRDATVRIVEVVDHGTLPTDPAVSVVVPLYGRIDLVQHQLAQLSLDPALDRTELIYVLDSPELAEGFLAEARRLHRFYRVPFRSVVLSANGGFSRANNSGVSVATGRWLVLCNSDVIPEQPGWTTELAGFLESTPDAVAVGPMLVYEDDSLQHAGMYFSRVDESSPWENQHYFKGIHRSFAPASVTRRVPAVSAACLAVERSRYLDAGGLGGGYLQGDYEDSDLCLRLTEHGGEIWYLPTVSLAHVEGASYPTPERVRYGRYNRWLHTRTWGERIATVMADPSHAPANVALSVGTS